MILYARVCALVAAKCRDRLEFEVAMLAYVFSFARVYAMVCLQIARCRELLGAYFTLIGLAKNVGQIELCWIVHVSSSSNFDMHLLVPPYVFACVGLDCLPARISGHICCMHRVVHLCVF